MDTTATQGLDKMSGAPRKGADVRREETNKQMAEALKPLFNETLEERKLRHHRAKLPEAARKECGLLDPQIRGAGNSTGTLLLQRRERYRELGC